MQQRAVSFSKGAENVPGPGWWSINIIFPTSGGYVRIWTLKNVMCRLMITYYPFFCLLDGRRINLIVHTYFVHPMACWLCPYSIHMMYLYQSKAKNIKYLISVIVCGMPDFLKIYSFHLNNKINMLLNHILQQPKIKMSNACMHTHGNDFNRDIKAYL